MEYEDEAIEEVEVPFDILGSIVTDMASGFTGMAVEFIRHLSGCFHVVIQPEGINPKTQSPVRKQDFDLRGCTGEMITKLSEIELKESKESNPSPAGDVTGRGFNPNFFK